MLSSGLPLVTTSLKLAELKGLLTAEVFDGSSCSVGLASTSFHSPVSVSRVSFQELVALVKVTAIERGFSILMKSLSSQASGLGSMLDKASEMTETLASLANLT